MGKRSLPPTRFDLRRALRLEPHELVVTGVALLLLLVVAVAFQADASARDRLQQEGRCLSAVVVESGTGDSQLLRRSARLRYDVDRASFEEELRYVGDRLAVGARVRICVDPTDPRSFFTATTSDEPTFLGNSTGWWALGIVSGISFGLGLLLLLVLVGRHQWRFPVEDADQRVDPSGR